jgi:hypothetical protein
MGVEVIGSKSCFLHYSVLIYMFLVVFSVIVIKIYL